MIMRLTVRYPNLKHDWRSAAAVLVYLKSRGKTWDNVLNLAAAMPWASVNSVWKLEGCPGGLCS